MATKEKEPKGYTWARAGFENGKDGATTVQSAKGPIRLDDLLDGYGYFVTDGGLVLYQYMDEELPVQLQGPDGYSQEIGHGDYEDEAEGMARNDWLENVKERSDAFEKAIQQGVYLSVFENRKGTCLSALREQLDGYLAEAEYVAISEQEMMKGDAFRACYGQVPSRRVSGVSYGTGFRDGYPRTHDAMKAAKDAYSEARAAGSGTCVAKCGGGTFAFQASAVVPIPDDLLTRGAYARRKEKEAAEAGGPVIATLERNDWGGGAAGKPAEYRSAEMLRYAMDKQYENIRKAHGTIGSGGSYVPMGLDHYLTVSVPAGTGKAEDALRQAYESLRAAEGKPADGFDQWRQRNEARIVKSRGGDAPGVPSAGKGAQHDGLGG